MRVDKASFLLVLLFLFLGCTSENDEPVDQTGSKRVRLASFGFEKRNNPALLNDYYSNNTDSDTLYFFIPDVENPSLVPSFTGDLKKVAVGG
jgi:hypothetical protein